MSRHARKPWLAAFLVSVALVPLLVALISSRRGDVVEDEWTLLTMEGGPVGHGHTTVVREGAVLRLEHHEVVRIARLGVVIQIEVTIATRETADGRLLGFTMTQDVAANSVEIEGTVRDGKLHVVSRTLGAERRAVIDWPEGTLFGYAQERHARSLRRTPGASFTFKTYNPELMKIVEVTYEVGETRDIDVLGRKVRATAASLRGFMPGVVPVEWRDADGVVWKIETGVAGLTMESYRTTREVALARSSRPASVDALTSLAVRVEADIEHPRKVAAATYRLRPKGAGSFDDLALDGAGQEATREADGSVLLRVESVRPDPGTSVGLPVRDSAMKKYLAASTYVQSDDPEILRVAREVTSGTRSSLAAAKALERWVALNITGKGYGTGFATASEVMEDRAGDCSEHAVLLCALLRAAGIPSRCAMGLVYVELRPGGPLSQPLLALRRAAGLGGTGVPAGEKAFWYHMWSEAYVGEWVPLDAVFPGRFVDAAHIRLAETALAGMSPGADVAELLQVLGRLEIDVIEYRSRGRVSQTGGRTEFVGRRYRDLDEGLAFDVPASWRVLRFGDERITEEGAVAVLVRKAGRKGERAAGGDERIAVLARASAAEVPLADEIARMTGRYNVTKREATKLGGREAIRLVYEARGRRREGIAAKRGGVLYLLRLAPATTAGSEALSRVAASFRFE